jgi:hypothetical protein
VRKLAFSWLPVAQLSTPPQEFALRALHQSRFIGKLKYMKRMYFWLIGGLLVIGGFSLWKYRGDIDFMSTFFPKRSAAGLLETARKAPLQWQPVDKSNMGFKLEMPGEPKQIVVQATTETGTTEPVSMLLVKPDSESSFAIAWAEKPPVARMNDLVPDKTLDQARDGAMSATQTTPITESRSTPQGFPGRDIVAHNAGGGILDTRFVYAGTRLYMLIAASPSASARREDAVMRFFNSFTISSNSQIPETLPAATE